MLKTWDEMNKTNGIDNYSNYMGDDSHKDMLVFLSRSRDSDTYTESNFDVALARLGGESDTVQIHRFGHWACGWFELILINPSNIEVVNEAELMQAALSDYPVLDDSDYYERENKKVMDYWKSCSLRERISLCKDTKTNFLHARFDDEPCNNDELYQCLAE